MKPSQLPEVRDSRVFGIFLRFNWICSSKTSAPLLLLPAGDRELSSGCNPTAPALLFNLISGSWVLYFDASTTAISDGRRSGRRFKELLSNYYPFGDEDLPADEAARVLYEAARNPLAHCLGVGKDKRVFPGARKVREEVDE